MLQEVKRGVLKASLVIWVGTAVERLIDNDAFIAKLGSTCAALALRS